MSQFTSGGQSIGVSAFSISPSNEYSGLISFRIDWFDLLTVQGTLKSLFQHHNSKASTPRCSAFFMVQLSHPYMTNGKTIGLTIWTFVRKVMSLLLNMLSRFVIVFLPRSKRLFISWLQSLSTVIFKPKKIKSVTVSTFGDMAKMNPSNRWESLFFVRAISTAFMCMELGAQSTVCPWILGS